MQFQDSSLPPVQGPINPPYKTACAMKHGEITESLNTLSLDGSDDCTSKWINLIVLFSHSVAFLSTGAATISIYVM